MGWKGIITDIGIAKLAECASGDKTMYVDEVYFGTGIVSEENMRYAEDLQATVGEGKIVRKKIQGNTVSIRISIGPQSQEQTIKEVGIYGYVDGDDYVLLALYQNEDGVVIPSTSEFPDFGYMLNAVWNIDNVGNLEVTVDASAVVTSSVLAEELAPKANNAIIAPDYDPETGFYKGQYCVHEGILYVCTSNGPIYDDFDESDWSEVLVTGEIKKKAEVTQLAPDCSYDFHQPGEIVTHEGKLYVHDSPLTYEGDFDPSYYQEVTMSNLFERQARTVTIVPETSIEIDTVKPGPFLLQVYNPILNVDAEGFNGLYIGCAGPFASMKAVLSCSYIDSISILGQTITIVGKSTSTGMKAMLYQF